MWAWIISHPGWAGMGAGFLIGFFIGWLVFALLVMASSECAKPSAFGGQIEFE
jgi:hypothetical protein